MGLVVALELHERSRVSDRIDAYYLSLSTHRDRMSCGFVTLTTSGGVLWITTSLPRRPDRGCKVPMRRSCCYRLFWANEAAGDMELDRPHWINEPGLLSVGQLKEIYRRVWPPGA